MAGSRALWSTFAFAAWMLAAGPAWAESPVGAADEMYLELELDELDELGAEPSPEPGAAAAEPPRDLAPVRRRRGDARPGGNELNRRLARGGMAFELFVRLAAVGQAARSCGADSCDKVAGMLPVVGAVATAVSSQSPEDRGLAIALGTLEATTLTLAALGVCDAWSDSSGGIRVGLRGPGLVVAGEF